MDGERNERENDDGQSHDQDREQRPFRVGPDPWDGLFQFSLRHTITPLRGGRDQSDQSSL